MTPRLNAIDVPYVNAPERTHHLAYAEWGDAANPNVLFCVHGLTRNARDFDFLAEALAGEFRILAVDMPGRGKSEWLGDPTEYNVASYLGNLVHLMEALQLPPVHWLGTSMGGILGMMMASSQPQRVRSLALNDVGAWIPARALRRLGEYVGAATHFDTRADAEQALRIAYAPFAIADERLWQHLFTHSLEDAPEGGVRVAYDPAIGSAFRDPGRIQDINLWKTWRATACPTLLLRGGESDLFSQRTALEMLGTRPGIRYLTFPGVGHAPPLMEPAQIAPVRDWLEERARALRQAA